MKIWQVVGLAVVMIFAAGTAEHTATLMTILLGGLALIVWLNYKQKKG